MTGGVSHEVSSPHYPQSNGKAEATVKSMKKLISAAWTDRQLTGPNSPEYCCNTATLPHGRMAYHRHKNLFGHPVQDTLPAHRRSFAPEWQKSTSEAESLDEKQQRILPEFTTNKHNPFPTYKWETMLPSSTQRDTYGSLQLLDHTGNTSSKRKAEEFFSETDDSFVKDTPSPSLPQHRR